MLENPIRNRGQTIPGLVNLVLNLQTIMARKASGSARGLEEYRYENEVSIAIKASQEEAGVEPWAVTPSQESKGTSSAASTSSSSKKYIPFGEKGLVILGIESVSENGEGTSTGFDFADQDMVIAQSLISDATKTRNTALVTHPLFGNTSTGM